MRSEAELESTRCDLCHADDAATLWKGEAWPPPVPEGVALVRCRRCGHQWRLTGATEELVEVDGLLLALGAHAVEAAPGECVTRGGAHDNSAEKMSATWRGRTVSRGPKAGHHSIGFRCAKSAG